MKLEFTPSAPNATSMLESSGDETTVRCHAANILTADRMPSIDASLTDPELIRLFEEELAPLESDEAHVIGHEQFKRLAEIRDDMAAIKRRINARLAELGDAPLYPDL